MKQKVLFIPALTHFLSSLIFPFVFWPETLIWPFFLLSDWLPYKDFTTVHTPLLPITLAFLYKFFGLNPWVLRIFAAGLLSLTNLLISKVVTRLTYNWKLGLISGFLFLYLSLTFEANTVWFESLLTPILLIIFILEVNFYQKPSRNKMIFIGLTTAFALLIKQTAFFIFPNFISFFASLYFWQKMSIKQIISYVPELVLPIVLISGLFVLILSKMNLLFDFWQWAVYFPFLLPSSANLNIPPDLLLPNRRQIILLIILVGIAIVTVSKSPDKKVGLLTLAWAILSLLFSFPRFAYFHLLPFIAFLSILLGANLKNRPIYYALILIVIISVLPVFKNTIIIGTRFLTPEVEEVANYIFHQYPKSKIYSLNGPDIVYFLTAKIPAVRPWVDQLPWQMTFYGEDRYLTKFKQSPPDLIIYQPYLTSPIDGLGAYQPKNLVNFVSAHYKIIKKFPSGVILLQKT